MSLAALRASWLAPVATRAPGTFVVAGDTLPIRDRQHSAISLLSLAQTIVGPLDIDPIRWGITSGGYAYIERTAAFDLVANGQVETCLGFTGTYTGQSSYTGDDVIPDAILPYGLRLDGPLWSAEGYRPANESGAATRAFSTGVSGTVLLDIDFATAWGLETTIRGQVYDIAHDGRWVSRARVMDVVRTRQGRRADRIVLSLSVQGVT